jgi:general transcriptional corepressor CYC8
MQRLNYSKAYEAYQQAVYRDSRNSNFWCSIGVLYWEINQFRDALDAYTRAIRLNPYIPEIWFNLGTLYEACNNQIQDAIDAYNRAYELDNNYFIVEERLTILKRNLETGRNDGPPPPRPSDIDPQRYEDFLQNQANAQNAAQLQGMQNSWGPAAGSGVPPSGSHRTTHQPPPPQHSQYPPRRSPDQLKTAPYSHPPASSYSNGSSGYGRPPAPPVTIKRGSSPPPPSYGYDARPPMGDPMQHQGYQRHDEMSHRPPHLPSTQTFVSPRQHERELGGHVGGSYPPPATRSPISYPNRNRSPPGPTPISQHGPPPDVKPMLDQGPPVSPGHSHNVQLAPLQSIRSPQSNIPPVPRNDAAAYPPPSEPGQKRSRDWDGDFNRGDSSRSSPHSRVDSTHHEERRASQERQEERRHSPQHPKSHDPAPRARSPLISPRTTEPSYIPAAEHKSPTATSRMEIDSPPDKLDRGAVHGEESEKMQIEEDKLPEPEAPARAMEIDEDYDKEDDKVEEK